MSAPGLVLKWSLPSFLGSEVTYAPPPCSLRSDTGSHSERDRGPMVLASLRLSNGYPVTLSLKR